jgi:hypothetical protein
LPAVAPADDLAGTGKRYDDDGLALENGDLQKVPAKAPGSALPGRVPRI